MTVKCLVRKGEYHDSVTLMRVAKLLAEQEGVDDSAVVMATKENKDILGTAGLLTKDAEAAEETDLVIAVKAKDPEKLLELATKELKAKKKNGPGAAYAPKSLDSALEMLPGANLALISVAGRYAADEAMKALERGLHVMLFSDNVSIEKEVELKKFAASKGLLIMGPDAGTAIINGVPLAFANNVARGPVGIVAASGTGLQECSTLLSNLGTGVSQAIGTGGRDVKKDVGGIMFLEGMKALIEDSATKVILLISKPPHESVLKKIVDLAKATTKPMIAVFLGAKETAQSSAIVFCANLEEAAYKAAYLAEGKSLNDADKSLLAGKTESDSFVQATLKKLSPTQKYLRGLYTGGTFVSETQVLADATLRNIHSNAPLGNAAKIENPNHSRENTVIDFGEDEFTVGRPHPMIDFSLRNRRIIEEAKDPETAVLLLDLVLGWGANPDPLPELLPVLEEAHALASKAHRHLPIVMSVTGTDADPQCRGKVIDALKGAGMMVERSNAAAARLAIAIAAKAQSLGGRQ